MTPTVTSLDLSRKLKEAGYPQEGYFWWRWEMDNPGEKGQKFHLSCIKTDAMDKDDIVAPLADEVLGRLPIEIKHREKGVLCLAIWRRNNGDWFVWYDNAHKIDDWFLHREIADTLCNAASKMYLYLAGKGLLK